MKMDVRLLGLINNGNDKAPLGEPGLQIGRYNNF